MNLLPQNSTKLETVLADAGDLKPEVISAVDTLPGFKFDPPDSFIPFLIWEYGLGEILPFLDNPRQAIQEGILWQRLRGTESGLRLALSWIGMQGVATEQEGVGEHYAEFQMDSGKVPKSIADLDALLKLTYLSAPLRSRLSRIYHGHDLRRFIHDETVYGDGLLSDYSGVRLEGYPVLSFGRTHASHAVLPEPASNHTLTSGFASEIKYEDRLIHDYFRWGDMPVQDYQAIHSRQLTSAAFYSGPFLEQGWPMMFWSDLEWGGRSEYTVAYGRTRAALFEPDIDYKVNRSRASLRMMHLDFSEDKDVFASRGTVRGSHLEWDDSIDIQSGRERHRGALLEPGIVYEVNKSRTSLRGTHIDLSGDIDVSVGHGVFRSYGITSPKDWPMMFWPDLKWGESHQYPVRRRSFYASFIDPSIDYGVSRTRTIWRGSHIYFTGDISVSSARSRERHDWVPTAWPNQTWEDSIFIQNSIQ